MQICHRTRLIHTILNLDTEGGLVKGSFESEEELARALGSSEVDSVEEGAVGFGLDEHCADEGLDREVGVELTLREPIPQHLLQYPPHRYHIILLVHLLV